MGESSMNIGLIPLDERPVNTRYPVLLTHGTDITVHIPPLEILSKQRIPADSDALLRWLDDIAGSLDALIVSVEMLGYGGLIASRITNEPADVIIARLAHLRRIREKHPKLTIYGFNVITRISRHNDNTEEPEYWSEYGERIFRWSQIMDQRFGESSDEQLQLQTEISPRLLHDFVRRRLRNHTTNLYMLQLLSDEVIDLLVVSSDDTSPYGLGSAEKRWLARWGGLADISGLLMYPGADEVGCVLLARLINQKKGTEPGFSVTYLNPDAANTVAAFEDVPVHKTVDRQISAAGAQLGVGITLLVNPPLAPDAEWVRDYTPEEAALRMPLLESLPQDISAIADVAHSNGADAAFTKAMIEQGLFHKINAYSAWNTAGNSIGTTVAAACMAFHYGRNPLWMAHRIIEDYLYQTIVRDEARDWLQSETGRRDPLPEAVEGVRLWIENTLSAEVDKLNRVLNLGYRIKNVRLPWNRTFEVDFDLEPVDQESDT
jgi:hypothetical protein